MLALLYWPTIVVLVLGGFDSLAEVSETAVAIVGPLLLVATWVMMERADTRAFELKAQQERIERLQDRLRRHNISETD